MNRSGLIRKAFIVAFLLITPYSTYSQNQRIAILNFERENTSLKDAVLFERSLLNAFINANTYDVLDRNHTETILAERRFSPNGEGQDLQAVKMGKLLKVQVIAVGSIIQREEHFFVEVKLIEIATARILKSLTGDCTQADQLPDLAKRIAERLTGVAVSEETAEVSVRTRNPYSSMTTVSSSEKQTRDRFQRAGIASFHYERFLESDLSLDAWVTKEQRSPIIAGIFGPLTFTSGYFYTRDYGNAALITLMKAVGGVGMMSDLNKGGSPTTNFYIFCGVFSAATVTDVIGSTIAARNRNKRLTRLTTLLKDSDYSFHLKNKTFSTQIHFTF